MGKRSWTVKDLKKLYRLREEGEDWDNIGDMMSKSTGACQRQYKRVDWEEFIKSPKNYFEGINQKKWGHDEMIKLDAYLQSDKSYEFIADKLDRSIVSVERQSQTTNWKAWRKLEEVRVEENRMAEGVEKEEALLRQLIDVLLTICRNDFKRIDSLKEKEFLERIHLDKERLVVSFEELKSKASERLVELGFGNPESVSYGPGTYVVVGDSHGKHTKKGMFQLMRKINQALKPDKIIHVGHILDDDNDISYKWGDFDNLIILSKLEELKIIQDQRNKFKFNYEIVRDKIELGDLAVYNQDLISDFVKTPISNLDAELFEDKVIVNCHRVEFTTRCCNKGASYMASPGCLCENHIISTIKQIDFEDGRVVKQAFPEGFVKYRRMRHLNKYWEQGLLVVHVDKDNNHTIVPCSIQKTKKGYTTSYFDKIITSSGVFNPERKIFVNGDMHCDLHDNNILDIQEQICKDYKPDDQVNVGDTFNYLSLNHHIMDRGGMIANKKILDEAASTHYVLKRVASWAKESHIIYGNHERFAKDFVEKYPQFGNYLDFSFLCDLEKIGYKLTDLKNVLKIGGTKFVHGEVRMYGSKGSKIEKASRTFGENVFIGHIHRPAIRFGCYSIGLSGKLDQGYNEPDASNWMHGFGLCNQFQGKSWPTTIAISNNSCVINKKTYIPVNPDSWDMPEYKVKIDYDFN